MREYITAAKVVADEEQGVEDGITFMVDGVECTAYTPEPGQVDFLMASNDRHTPMAQKIAGFINFFMAVMDEDTATHLSGRLLDRNDPFDVDQVENIFNDLMEEWGGRPTQSSTGSTPSRRTGGRKSTQRTPTST